ncbi:hypothetical protein M9458_052393, partial [Cirrhinus mrigala]
LFPAWTEDFQGVPVPLTIIGDAAYPLLPWLQKPSAEGQGLTQAEQQYNYRLSRARMCVECAFERLKPRNNSTSSINTVFAPCCTLHNICESRGEALEPKLIDDNDSNNETEMANTE